MAGYQRFGGPYCLHLQSEVKMEAAVSPETLVSCDTTWRRNSKDLDLKSLSLMNIRGVPRPVIHDIPLYI